jgi:hypothetical protein
VVGAAASAILALQAGAIPRYTARYEQKCALCHVNPSGGGLRTPYAVRDLIPRELAWSPGRPELLAELDPAISKHVSIGTDFRELFVGTDTGPGRPNFFQMQGDVYFDFQLDPRISLYYDRGMSSSYELFGLGYVHPVVYVKAGRFVPSYGWKFDDHTMFVRSELGFSPPAHSDAGIEIGASPGRLDVQAGLVNGSRGSLQDTDTRLAAALNAAGRVHVGPFALSAGLSVYHDPDPQLRFDARGIYGYATWRNLTWLGEADWFRQHAAGAHAVEGVVTSHELTALVQQGLELKATYDFFDPDRDRETGAKSRWGGGVAVLPRAYVALEAMFRKTQYDDGIAYSGSDVFETVLQLHLLY